MHLYMQNMHMKMYCRCLIEHLCVWKLIESLYVWCHWMSGSMHLCLCCGCCQFTYHGAVSSILNCGPGMSAVEISVLMCYAAAKRVHQRFWLVTLEALTANVALTAGVQAMIAKGEALTEYSPKRTVMDWKGWHRLQGVEHVTSQIELPNIAFKHQGICDRTPSSNSRDGDASHGPVKYNETILKSILKLLQYT